MAQKTTKPRATERRDTPPRQLSRDLSWLTPSLRRLHEDFRIVRTSTRLEG